MISRKISLGYIYLRFQQLNNQLGLIIVKVIRQFLRPKMPQFVNSEINLHLGCGSINHPMFINIDGRPDSHIHYVRAIDNLSPFKNSSVSLIYACHCLEHFPYAETNRVLCEWHRVLKKGGILRLSVPDIDLLIALYQDIDKDLEPIMGLFMGGQDYEFNFHKSLFNFSSLKKAFLQAGFSEVRSWEPGKCELTTFDDWSGRLVGGKYLVSLNLEAIK